MQTKEKNTIMIGKPITVPSLIPVLHRSTPRCLNEVFMVDGVQYNLTCLSFESPHAVLFVQDFDAAYIERVGSVLENHVLFPLGASIVFAKENNLGNDGFSLSAQLWQRDEGKKEFTPEAACAAAVAAILLRKTTENCADIHMGGTLYHVDWNRKTGNVSLSETG